MWYHGSAEADITISWPSWPAIRATLLTVVVVANLLHGIPPGKIEEADLDDDDWRKGQFSLSYMIFENLGLYDDFTEYRRDARAFLWAYKQKVRALQKPGRVYFGRVKSSQRWGLFAVVTERPDALLVEIKVDGEWRTLYRRLDPEHDWLDDQLKYRRIRGIWDGVKDEPKPAHSRFRSWLARRVFAEFPRAKEVRISLERGRLSAPWEALNEEVTIRAARSLTRKDVYVAPQRKNK